MIEFSLMIAGVVSSPTCDWSKPNTNPFQGNVPQAIHKYTDIPSGVRAELSRRMETRTYDDFVLITKNKISGKHEYAQLRDMHFGNDKLCVGLVDKSKWSDDHQERGLVYCVGEYCILVPTVCRNVSRVTKFERKDETSSGMMEVPGGFEQQTNNTNVIPDVNGEVKPVTVSSFEWDSSPEPPPVNTYYKHIDFRFHIDPPRFFPPIFSPQPTNQTFETITQPVPEPETLAMIFVGLALIYFVTKRKLSK